MFSAIASQPRPGWVRLFAIVLVVLLFAGCKKDQTDQAADAAAEPTSQAAEAAQEPAVASKVEAMSAEELREAAGTALREQRLYAPGGDNAMEYYLALRDKQPNDPAVTSALTDLQPYALIATEQSISRDDFDEAQRLYALLEKADPRHPALARLEKAITDGRTALAERQQREELRAEEEAERQAELQRQREADQQAAQQEAARRLEAERARQEQEQQQQQQAAAAAPAATQPSTPAASRPAAQPQQQPATPPPPPQPQVANTLRPIRVTAPEYPRAAQRRRTAGRVEVEFTVGTDGTVTSSRVVSASPPRVFDRAALSAVDSWTFEPLSSPITTRRAIEFKPVE